MISNVEINGINSSFAASKYPFAADLDGVTDSYTDRIKSLASCPMGTGHDNFLIGINVQFDLKMSLKAWAQADRYHFLDFVSSQSTMHVLQKFDIDKQCNEWVDEQIKERFKELIAAYLTDKTDENRLRMLYNIPSGFMLTARMTTNYRQLKTIYHQRKHHFLPEWHDFCSWIETLPYSELITGGTE